MLLPKLLQWIWENDGITRSRVRKGNPAPKRPRNLTRRGELVVEWVTPGWPPRETGLGAGIFDTTFINVFLGNFFIDGGRYFQRRILHFLHLASVTYIRVTGHFIFQTYRYVVACVT